VGREEALNENRRYYLFLVNPPFFPPNDLSHTKSMQDDNRITITICGDGGCGTTTSILRGH
jgi:hypothetical protein